MVEREKSNPRLPFSQSIDKIPAPKTGTTGYAESMSVETIDNTPEPVDAPTNTPANWSAT